MRKLLEITYKEKNEGLYLVCSGNEVKGYISPKRLQGEFYLVEFCGNGKWAFSYQGSDDSKITFQDRKVLVSKQNDKYKEGFFKQYRKIFANSVSMENIEKVWSIVENAREQKHGTLLLFSQEADTEKKRLCSAGYWVSVAKDISCNMEAISRIDGAVLMDQNGEIYMIGVILDGEMPPCGINMERGARYNSAVKYSYAHRNEKHLLVVISEDGYFNLINYNLTIENA